MTRDEALHRLAAAREALETFHISSLSLFGSVARNEANEASDLDVLVEFAEPIGLFDFVRLRRALEKALEVRVDLVTPAALHKSHRDRILREAIRAA